MMSGLFRFIGALLAPIFALLNKMRLLLVAILAIGIPVWIYVAFIAKEPVFSIENDVQLGQQSQAAIESDPEEYPLLSEEDYPEAYEHMKRIVGKLIASPEIDYGNLFPYRDVKIIHQDDVLNAFCTPGGFIYVYTGLIHYLDAEDHLAGVLGHEVAHAERRHSSVRLQRDFGTERLLEFAILAAPMTLRDAATLAIVNELTTLRYSRSQEAESDDDSVRYLASTSYACDGAAGFFQKILDQGDGVRIPEFLSDHPEPAARVSAIGATARELGCSTSLGNSSQWEAFKASLPPPVEKGDETDAESETAEDKS